VIARNSTFTYKGKPVKIKQVSEDLGVRYVLEGSVQKSGDRVRITAQLIVKRKLMTILSADVKGYSRLMGEDEEWRLRTLNSYKRLIIKLVSFCCSCYSE
jgi:class 3 adenylate cyclase